MVFLDTSCFESGKLAKSFPDTLVTVTKGDKTVKASQLMKLRHIV